MLGTGGNEGQGSSSLKCNASNDRILKRYNANTKWLICFGVIVKCIAMSKMYDDQFVCIRPIDVATTLWPNCLLYAYQIHLKCVPTASNA